MTHVASGEHILHAELELALDLHRRVHRDHAPRLRLDLVPRLQPQVEHTVAVAVVDPELRALDLTRRRDTRRARRGR